MVLQPLLWRWAECEVHHERNVREEQHHRYEARTTNARVILSGELYCCLLPQSKALRICRSSFLIATILLQNKRPKSLSEKIGFCIVMFRNLWTTVRQHFNKIWRKSYVFQNKVTIVCQWAKRDSSTSGLGNLSKSLPQSPYSNIHLVCEAGFSNPVHIWYYGKTKVKE